MNRSCLSLWTAVVSWSVLLMLLGPASASAESRQFTFEYETTIGPMEPGAGPVDVFVPLAVQNAEQRVLDEEIVASIPGTIEVEDAYGNRFWHGRIENSGTAPIKVSVRTSVERRITAREALAASRGLGQEDRERFEKFLRPNRRVLVDHPMLAPIRKEIRILAGGDDPARVARAIYDWVIANVEYKKVGTGWGNGDTFWACTERYGNCTDFHALFISLARSEGIPARFEIGFPVPEDRPSGKVGGYHCWVEFYLPEIGWFPIDASEAFKHPERKEFLYGGHPGDRIHFSTGRDLALGEGHASGPLNYFVYPHVEVAGSLWKGEIEKSFRYEEIPNPVLDQDSSASSMK